MEKNLTDINPIKLTEKNKISVKVKGSDSEFFYTDISLEYGRPPKIQLRRNLKEKDLIVQPIIDSHYNTYYISDIHFHDSFSPAIFKYLFVGNADKDNLKKVYFIFPELSSYFHREISYTLDNDVNISGNLKIEPLEARIESLGLSIKIHQGYSLKSNEDHTGFSFKNTIYFSFESDTVLSFQDIEKLMYKATGLLTWITGYPLSLESIEVSDGEKDGYLYLPLVKKLKIHDVSFPKSFMQVGYLRQYFNTICNNYFEKKEIFEDIWSRTLPLFDFTGVLEYEVMLYASVLDKYFSYQIDHSTSSKIQDYDAYLLKIEEFFKKNEQLKELLENTELFENIKLNELKKVFPENKFQTFLSKQKEYFRMIDNQSLKIFLNKNDFIKIISIRDNAAHGTKESLQTEEVLRYLWKVKLLTMYLIYMDLGIHNNDFFEMISNTFHPIAMNCEIDKYLLDIKIGKTICITLSKCENEKMKKCDTKIKVFNKKKRTTYLIQS